MVPAEVVVLLRRAARRHQGRAGRDEAARPGARGQRVAVVLPGHRVVEVADRSARRAEVDPGLGVRGGRHVVAAGQRRQRGGPDPVVAPATTRPPARGHDWDVPAPLVTDLSGLAGWVLDVIEAMGAVGVAALVALENV